VTELILGYKCAGALVASLELRFVGSEVTFGGV